MKYPADFKEAVYNPKGRIFQLRRRYNKNLIDFCAEKYTKNSLKEKFKLGFWQPFFWSILLRKWCVPQSVKTPFFVEFASGSAGVVVTND